jgi:hypothetical protein
MRIVYGRALRLTDYFCGGCNKGRRKMIKLWRLYNTMVSNQQLRCVDCASRQAGLDPRAVREDGTSPDQQYGTGAITSLIGSTWTAAYPAYVVDGHIDNYWGRTSAPPEAVAWWRALPLR